LLVAALALALSAPVASLAAGRPGNPHGGKQFAKNHPRRNQVNGRVANQRARINQGVKNGTMTKAQARQDRQQLDQMKAQEHADVKANGGHLTKGEQRQLNQEENANSRMIHDEKHPAGQ